jgi:hypothetical protein
MSIFDDRETAYENKFAHDAEMEFRAEALRNRQIAYWAAEVMGKDASFAADYAKTIIRTDFLAPGHEDVVSLLVKDLEGKADEATIRAKMDELLNAARQHLRGDA